MTLHNRLPDPPLLLITDAGQAPRPLVAQVEGALEGGCRWLLLREKHLSGAVLAGLARQLKAVTDKYGARLLISGEVAFARELGLAGVHLPAGGDPAAARRALGKAALIGYSAHDLRDAEVAVRGGVDYLTLSPVFASASKPGYGPLLGLSGLRRIADKVPIPVLALAGVTPDRVADCVAVGAAGVAVMGEIMRAAAPADVTKDYLTQL